MTDIFASHTQNKQRPLAIERLCFKYATAPLLQNISLNVEEGDFVVLTGSNGVGKTTLLRLILGELAPETGEIRLFGETSRQAFKKRQVAYVEQHGMFNFEGAPTTPYELIRANCWRRWGSLWQDREYSRTLTKQALADLGLEDKSKNLYSQLSGGQKQRALLARALVVKPKLLLLDEPYAGVDRETTARVTELLCHLNHQQKMTIVMVTHDVISAVEIASRFLCLEHGDLMEITREQVLYEEKHRHKHKYAQGGTVLGREER